MAFVEMKSGGGDDEQPRLPPHLASSTQFLNEVAQLFFSSSLSVQVLSGE